MSNEGIDDEQSSSALTTRKPSNRSLEELKREIEYNSILRESRLKAAEDWIGFGVTKVVGIGSLVIGGLEAFLPSVLAVTLVPPFTPYSIIGIGLALLSGKKTISLVKTVLETLVEADKNNDDLV